MDESIIEDIKEGILVLKVIVESENIKLIFTCPKCETEHDLAKLTELLVENNLKDLPDLACLHCHHTFDLSETKEFEDIRKNLFQVFVRIIAKMKNIPKDDGRLNEFVNTMMGQK